jgi:hypothetical protein
MLVLRAIRHRLPARVGVFVGQASCLSAWSPRPASRTRQPAPPVRLVARTCARVVPARRRTSKDACPTKTGPARTAGCRRVIVPTGLTPVVEKSRDFAKIAEDCTPGAAKVPGFHEDFPKIAKIAPPARTRPPRHLRGSGSGLSVYQGEGGVPFPGEPGVVRPVRHLGRRFELSELRQEAVFFGSSRPRGMVLWAIATDASGDDPCRVVRFRHP